MKAAVLRTLGKPPRFEEFPDPKPSPGEVIIHVKAASLKNIDKMMASGSHYDSHRELPVVCGTDGVGILDDGTRVFCGGSRPPYGMMAERTVVSRTWCLPIPDGVDDVKGKLNYLSIPILLSFKPIPLLSLQAGPQFGILLSQDKNLVDNGKDAFKKGDFSLVGGAQLNLANIVVGGRYVIGLTDINDVTSNNKWKNQGFQVYAGFRFF